MWQMIRQERRFLVGIFLISFILRAILFLIFTRHDHHAWIYFDSDQYVRIAQHVAQGDGFCLQKGVPEFYRLPGYPLFLALGYKLFFMHQEPMLWFQMLLASLIPVLIFLLSLSLFPTVVIVARVAAIVAAAHLGLMLYAGMIATESLFILLFLLFVLLFVRSFHFYHTNVLLFYAGLSLGLASLMRPVGHYLVIIAIGLIVMRQQVLKVKIKHSCCLVVGWLVPLIPWLLRNAMLTGALFFHTLPGLHFLQYTAANAVSMHDKSTYLQARGRLLKEWEILVKQQEKLLGRELNDYEQCCIGERLAHLYVCRYPWQSLHYSIVQLIKTGIALYSAQLLIADTNIWPDYGPHAGWRVRVERFLFPEVQHRFLIALVYYEILLFLLLVIGLCACAWYGWRSAVVRFASLHVLPYAVLLWIVTIAYGCARLRLPFEPLLIMFSIYGWYLIFNRNKQAIRNDHATVP